VRDWEQKRSEPNAEARTYLKVVEKEPEAVKRALAAA
jgi:putative transcriptional regulator